MLRGRGMPLLENKQVVCSLGFLGFSVLGCRGFLVSWFLGSLVSWLLGVKASWLLGLSVSRFLGFLVSKFLGFEVSKVSKMQKFFNAFGNMNPILSNCHFMLSGR